MVILETVEVQLDELTPYKDNPRRGNTDLIAESLMMNGQYRAIVVNKGTLTGRRMEVLAGNHTVAAARVLGWESIMAHLVDVDEKTARTIVLVDNRANDVAGYDSEGLLELLQGMAGWEGTGYTGDDVAALIAELGHFDTASLDDLEDEFGVPEDNDLWVNYTVRLPRDLKLRFESVFDAMPGVTNPEKITALLNRVG